MAEQPKPETLEPEASKSPMPFADLSKTMAELYPGKMMEQLTKTFGEYKLPGIDVDALLEHNRKNVDALSAANKRMLENAQTVMTRQGEMLRQTLEEASAALKSLSSAGTPQDLVAKEGELIRHVFLRTLDNMREVADMTTQSSNEAFEAVNERVRENVDDIKALLKRLEK
ncbi:MAG: phasin family protein [Gammaproteobacteria bacterium]